MLMVSLLVMATAVAKTSSVPNINLPSSFYPVDGSRAVTKDDDLDGSGEIILDVPFPFLYNTSTSIWVANHGYITFDGAANNDYVSEFPICRRIISPFWARATTTNPDFDYYDDAPETEFLDGTVYYLQTQNQSALTRAKNDVEKVYSGNISPTGVFIATWYRLGKLEDWSKENTFQCVLVTDGTRSFAIFHYGNMTWGSPTQIHFTGLGVFNKEPSIGYSAGRDYYFNHPLANTAEGVKIADTTNTGIKGQYILRVDVSYADQNPCA